MKTRNLLLFLLCFLALGAFYGGGLMILDSSGEMLGMPISMLDNASFNNFLIPGIILFTVLGIAPSLLVYALIKKPKSSFAEKFNAFKDMHWSWSFNIYIGFTLIIWIQLQMLIIKGVGWLHTLYVFLALVILFVALMPKIRRLYKKQNIN